MHEYYQRSRVRIRRQMDGYLRMVEPEVVCIFGKPYAEIFDEIWNHYEQEMLSRLPYIGGDKVSGTKNLVGATFFIAIGVVGRAHGLSLEEWGHLVTTLYERYFSRLPWPLRRLVGVLLCRCPRLVVKALRRKDRINAANAAAHPGSFVTQTQPPTARYPVNYHTLVCPVCDFCQANGYMDYLPYLCNLDYVMFGALGVPLHRAHTCASGDGYCDFKVNPCDPVPDNWPPHILDDSDPLK